MIKEFKIDEILNAVGNIDKIKSKKDRINKIKNDFIKKEEVLSPNNQVKSNKSDVLVLDQMIE
tara:strand:- start:49 stop:237 length:189 start_codon:yes stop_codon:yes gene_type:complete